MEDSTGGKFDLIVRCRVVTIRYARLSVIRIMQILEEYGIITQVLDLSGLSKFLNGKRCDFMLLKGIKPIIYMKISMKIDV